MYGKQLKNYPKKWYNGRKYYSKSSSYLTKITEMNGFS